MMSKKPISKRGRPLRPQTGAATKHLSHSMLYNIPRSKIERGIYYKPMRVNELVTTINITITSPSPAAPRGEGFFGKESFFM